MFKIPHDDRCFDVVREFGLLQERETMPGGASPHPWPTRMDWLDGRV